MEDLEYSRYAFWWDEEIPEPREFLVTEEMAKNFDWEENEEDEDEDDI